jgi:hypothetical protein
MIYDAMSTQARQEILVEKSIRSRMLPLKPRVPLHRLKPIESSKSMSSIALAARVRRQGDEEKRHLSACQALRLIGDCSTSSVRWIGSK